MVKIHSSVIRLVVDLVLCWVVVVVEDVDEVEWVGVVFDEVLSC